MKELIVRFDERTLSMQGPTQSETLGIKNNYPWTPFSEYLFSQLGTMHLVAPYLPPRIRTNFWVDTEIRQLMGRMYRWEEAETPRFLMEPRFSGRNNICSAKKRNTKTTDKKVAIAYSAGKDSMWNLMWASEKYGMDNVLVVHIQGLNKNNGPGEVKNVLRQQKRFGIKHLRIIELHNGSLNTGFRIMRSREIFLAGLIIPVAMEFGASQIIKEGFFDVGSKFFTDQKENIDYFNHLLRLFHIPVRVAWQDRDEMLTIKDLFDKRPKWMPHLCNCFTIACYQSFHRRNFQKTMPTFPLYDSQCGVCVKCRITNVARVLYDPKMAETSSKDIVTFLYKTDTWVRGHQRARDKGEFNSMDMIEGAFLRDFGIACKRYGVNGSSLARN